MVLLLPRIAAAIINEDLDYPVEEPYALITSCAAGLAGQIVACTDFAFLPAAAVLRQYVRPHDTLLHSLISGCG